MIAAALLRMFNGALIAAALLGSAAYWELLIAQGLHGVATGAFMPASGSIIPDVVPEEAAQPTNTLKAVARSIAGVSGPALDTLAILLSPSGLAPRGDDGGRYGTDGYKPVTLTEGEPRNAGRSVALAGSGEAAFGVPWETTVQQNVKGRELARICSFEQFGSLALVLLGFMLGGRLEQAIGAGATLLASGLVLLSACAGPLALPCIRHLRARVRRGRFAGEPPRALGRHAPLLPTTGEKG